MTRIKTDLLVIGAGSGGLSVAAGAAQMGADVTLLEPHKMGGDCLNYGCVPSKALLAAGKRASQIRDSAKFGLTATVDVDYVRVMDHVRDVIAQIEPHDSQARFEGLGVRVLRHAGRFVGPTTVQAGDTEITARRIVIATGAHAFVPPIPGLADVPYLTNETLFDLTQAPDHLIVIGGGPIGVEMAQAHARLGVRVSLVDMGPILPMNDEQDRDILRDQLTADGVVLHENVGIQNIAGDAGAIAVHLDNETQVSGSHLLVATGRRPNVHGLDLERANIAYSDRGITVGADLKTSNPKVYAIGDVIGGAQFTHVAGYHAGVVIRSAMLALPAKASNTAIPTVTYTDPEIATVGLSQDQARAKFGGDIELVRFEHAGNDRAVAERVTQGHTVAIVVRGRVVGVRVVGHQAGELINFWTYMVTHREKIGKLAGMISPYPTLTEINKRVAGAYFSPRLFDNVWLKRFVRFVQKRLG